MDKGPRVAGSDYFADVMKRQDGIFAGLGQDQYEGIRDEMAADGVNVTMSCRKCGKPRIVTLEWKELVIASMNGPNVPLLLPAGWHYSKENGALYPALQCCSERGDTHGMLCPMVTPDEARKYVNDAVTAGLLPAGAVQQWAQQISLHR